MMKDENKTKKQLSEDLKKLRSSLAEFEKSETDHKRTEEKLKKSLEREKFWSNIVQKASVAVAIGYPDGRLGVSNAAYQKLTGYSDKELQTIEWNKILTPPEWEKHEATKLQELHRTKKPVRYEKEYLRKDGRRVPIVLVVHPKFDSDGNVEYYFAFVLDITERKQAEEKIENLNSLLRAIRNVNQLITKEKDRDKLLKGVCENLIETRDYHYAWVALMDKSGKLVTTAEAGLGKDLLPVIEQLERGKLPVCVEKALKQSEAQVTENPSFTCTGCPLAEKSCGKGSMAVRLEAEGKIYGTLIVSIPRVLAAEEEEQDLSKEVAGDVAFALHNMEVEEARRQAEKALKDSEKKYRSLFDNALDMIHIIDNNLRIIDANRSELETLGYSREELLGKPLEEIIHPDHQIFTKEALKKVWRGESVSSYETAFVSKKGKKIIIEVNAVPQIEDGVILEVRFIMRDITERKRSEDELNKYRDCLAELVEEATVELRKNEKQLRAIADTAKDAIIMSDENLHLSFWNPAAQKIFGYSIKEALGKKMHLLIIAKKNHEAYRKWMDTIKQKGKGPLLGKTSEFMAVRNNKEEFPVEVSVSSLEIEGKTHTVGIIRDITERKEFQEQLVRKDKLAFLGQLAGGVAHEMRNPLGSIQNVYYFLNMSLEKPDKDVREMLNVLKEEITVASSIINTLLDFARPEISSRYEIDVNSVVQRTLSHLKVPENIEVKTQLDRTVHQILADPDQIERAFWNIVLNAIQAMPKGGRLTIKSKSVDSNQIVVSFKDTGDGIQKNDAGKIFEPLFTTKAKGIGLGLALTKQCIEKNGGTIEVQSKEDVGSTFIIKLPTAVTNRKKHD
ncbi:MAG: PAS domain S-box protein [Methanosarcinaceae archaeon]|nr:PAS domain S-box protein [Methanosarcinaceae archaeon]